MTNAARTANVLQVKFYSAVTSQKASGSLNKVQDKCECDYSSWVQISWISLQRQQVKFNKSKTVA